MAERDELALREALRTLGRDGTVDPKAARRRAQERRRSGLAAVGVAVALLLVAGVIGIPRLLPAEQASPTLSEPAGPEGRPGAAPVPTDPAPAGWRTEYFRDISFQVPKDWGYAVPPQSDWCANGRTGQPRPEQRRPYVWLGGGIAVRAIGCPTMPTSLLTEHVEAVAAGPAATHVEETLKKGDWWVINRVTISTVLTVTTKDASLAEQILGSVKLAPRDAPCPPTSPVSGPLGSRPTDSTDLTALTDVDHVMLCQYVPELEPGAGLPQFRAAHLVTGRAADQFVARLQSAPVNNSSCDPAPDPVPDLAVLVRVTAGDRTFDVYIAATGCPDGDSGMAGGIDDGTTVRLLTRQVCRSVLTLPLAMFSGSGEVGRNCLG
jgi:hypothetical protein